LIEAHLFQITFPFQFTPQFAQSSLLADLNKKL